MEIHERIKELRKKHLKLSQTAFGECLGVSRSVINNIELNVLARPEQKMSLYKLICSEFNVNEDWLLNGNGDMFVNNEAIYSSLIDQIMSGENEFAKNIFKTFAAFEESDWEALQHMVETFRSICIVNSNEPKTCVSSNKTLYDQSPDFKEIEKEFPPVNPTNKSIG